MDKAALFAPRLPQSDVEIPGVGTVTVRGLSRVEAMLVQKAEDPETRERKILAFGMVDPQITEHEAGKWQQASAAAELEQVTTVIANLSGLNPDAPKEAVKTFRDGPGAGVHVLPGAEAGDDGGEAPGGDVER